MEPEKRVLFFPGVVVKSAGRMLTLMHGTTLPLEKYVRGRRCFYTVKPFGPRPGFLYDWDRASPIRFTERQVEKAIAAGFVIREGGQVFMTIGGSSLAEQCSGTWKPEIDEYFKDYNIDWRTMRD